MDVPPLVTGLWLVALVSLVAGGWRLHRSVTRHRRTDWGAGWMNWLDGFNRLFCERYHRLAPVRLPLPPEGPAVLVANHVSGLDPLVLIAAADRPLRFLIAREQYFRFGFQWLFRAVGCIPVDRTGRPERALREAYAALRAGEVVAIFPHGRIHLPDDPPRRPKGGAARLALAIGCPLVPAIITGVSGVGRVVGAVFLRSRVEIALLPVVDPEGEDFESLMEKLEKMLV